MAAGMRHSVLQPIVLTGNLKNSSYVHLQIVKTLYTVGLSIKCSKGMKTTNIRKNTSKSRGPNQNISKNPDYNQEKRAKKQIPVVKDRDNETKNAIVEYLNRQSIDAEIVGKRLNLERLNVGDVKKRMKFLSYELNLEKISLGKILTKRPFILVLKEEVLRNRLDTLHKVGISYEAMSLAVNETPGILTSKLEESLPAKVEFLLNLRVVPKFTKNDVLNLITKCPDLIASCNLKSLENKIEFLQTKLEFNKHQLRNILIKQPSILTFSTQAIGEKFKYCFEKLNASPSSITRCPRVFQCSMKRIRERHLYLVHMGRFREEMIIDDYGLGVILTSTDLQFATKVAKSTKENFDQFRKSL